MLGTFGRRLRCFLSDLLAPLERFLRGLLSLLLHLVGHGS